jgi:SAM-dependent methyltransferase
MPAAHDMSYECGKSMLRRLHSPLFHQRVFVGRGLDIGSGDDSLAMYAYLFPRITAVDGWDKINGDAQTLPGIDMDTYDFVHASHCLEHLDLPGAALSRWCAVLKPGGHLVVTVPDAHLYEHDVWPSLFNAEHKHAFTLDISRTASQKHIVNVPEMLYFLNPPVHVVRVELIEATFDARKAPTIDQTLGHVAECCIEFIVRKGEAA